MTDPNTIPAHWTDTIETLTRYVAEHGYTLTARDVEYIDEDDCETPGGEIALLGGRYFLSRNEAGELRLDDGVDESDPSVGIFNAMYPAGRPQATNLTIVAAACMRTIAEWNADAGAEF
jgi:hypothetical protein